MDLPKSINHKPFDKLRNTKNLVFLSVMMALYLVLRSISIAINPYIYITFGFVPLMIIAKIFGPPITCISGILVDILAYIISPKGPYIFGFTINAGLSGLIYGLFLYEPKFKPTKLWKIISAKTSVQVFINILLTTLWLAMTYGKSYKILFYPRLIKNLIQLPVDIVIAYSCLKLFDVAYNRLKRK